MNSLDLPDLHRPLPPRDLDLLIGQFLTACILRRVTFQPRLQFCHFFWVCLFRLTALLRSKVTSSFLRFVIWKMSKKFHISEDDLGIPFLSELLVQLSTDEYMNPASEVQVTKNCETNISEIVFSEPNYNELDQVLAPHRTPSLLRSSRALSEENFREEMHDDEIISLLASLLDAPDATAKSYKPSPWMISGRNTTEGGVLNGSESRHGSIGVRASRSVSCPNKPNGCSECLDTEIFSTQTSKCDDNVANTCGTTVEECPGTSTEPVHFHRMSNASLCSKNCRSCVFDVNRKPVPTGRKHQWYTRGDSRIYCRMKSEGKGCPPYFLSCTNLTVGGPTGICTFRAELNPLHAFCIKW